MAPLTTYRITSTSPPRPTGRSGVREPRENEPPAQMLPAVNLPVVFTTYGALSAGTNAPAGEYSDIVIAIVTF